LFSTAVAGSALIQQISESHRFAITFHRERRGRRHQHSELGIPDRIKVHAEVAFTFRFAERFEKLLLKN
jgi:excinuclease UvrABC nuclease subunit